MVVSASTSSFLLFPPRLSEGNNPKNPFTDLPPDEREATLRRQAKPKPPQQEENRKSMARTRLQRLRDMEEAGEIEC